MSGIFSGIGKLGSMLGLGYGATYVVETSDELRNAVLDLGRLAAQSISLRRNSETPSTSSQEDDPRVLALTRQLEQLTNQVERMSFRRADGPRQGTSVSYIIPITIGLGVVIYIKYKGYKIGDLFYVTQLSFRNGLEGVSNSITKVKQQLSLSLDHLTGRVNEGLETQRLMALEVSETREQIQRLEGIVLDVEGRIDKKLDSNSDKLDYTVNGIGLLCNVVSNVIEQRPGGSEVQEQLKYFGSMQPITAGGNTPQMLPAAAQGGLKSLASGNGSPNVQDTQARSARTFRNFNLSNLMGSR